MNKEASKDIVVNNTTDVREEKSVKKRPVYNPTGVKYKDKPLRTAWKIYRDYHPELATNIVTKAVADAEKGDKDARKFLADLEGELKTDDTSINIAGENVLAQINVEFK